MEEATGRRDDDDGTSMLDYIFRHIWVLSQVVRRLFLRAAVAQSRERVVGSPPGSVRTVLTSNTMMMMMIPHVYAAFNWFLSLFW